MPVQGEYGLGDPLQLEKIDKLFACGVGELVDLPQIVVVGDQSSGKSSVLEGLIKKPLPRDSGLCTRFATQFVFRRAEFEDISVSLIPDRDASEAHIAACKAWKKEHMDSLGSEDFTQIMKEVHDVMGLSTDSGSEEKKPTFSNDVLRLEIAGPEQEHLSVIDVPGIFKSTTEGVTTKSDIELVRSMVLSYMKNPRSVMLAVIPANVDVATQEILEMAKEVDAEGDRTLGVLTKPDLVDKGAESKVVGLVNGASWTLKLGWHLVRNPGQQQLADSSLDRGDLEMSFFRSTSPWNEVSRDRVGIESLRAQLKEVLAGLIKRTFPKVQQEIRKKLLDQQKKLESMGPERESSAAQLASLTEIATKFQRLVTLALAANYGADSVFESTPHLRIAPAITARMNTFSDAMTRCGQEYAFLPQDKLPVDEIPDTPFDTEDSDSSFFTRTQDDVDDLVDILHSQQELPHPKKDVILQWLRAVYRENRGFELGTFNPAILATAMKKQSSKWSDVSLAYVSDVIVMVHNFITAALKAACPDQDVRRALFNIMIDKVIGRYLKAIRHMEFLLRVESSGTPLTLNHYFNDNLQKSRQEKLEVIMESVSVHVSPHGEMVRLRDITSQAMSNEVHIIHDIHDILKSYYKVSRKTFVDNVCKQVCDHFLLTGPESPLALFSPIYISHLSTEELENIAGEAPAKKRMRAQLNKELASLTDAKQILARA